MALVRLLGTRTYSVELRRDLEELEKSLNDLVRRVAPLFVNEPSASFTSTTNNEIILPASALADPTNPVILTHTPGVLRTAMRSDGAPKLSQAIAPTWTASHTWSPSANSVPITVNAPAILSSANMQTWSPLFGYDTVVTKDGNVGVGDESPAAMISVKQRAQDVSAAAILELGPYAWWNASDLDGVFGTNSGYSDGQDLCSTANQWKDRSGNGHHLTFANIGSPPTAFLRKGTGPNGKDWLQMTSGALPSAWATGLEDFGNPAAWAMYAVGSLSYWACKAKTINLDGHLDFGGQAGFGHYFQAYTQGGDPPSTEYSIAWDFLPAPTPFTATGAIGDTYVHGHTFSGGATGTHAAYCQGTLLTSLVSGYPRSFGNGANIHDRSSWGRLHFSGDNTETSRSSNDVEILLFKRVLSTDERLLVEA